MDTLEGTDHEIALGYLIQAAKAAKNASCLRSRCGAVIIAVNGNQIGSGYNSLPACFNKSHPATCSKDFLPTGFKSDRTCCIHAEQRAIFEALKNNSDKLVGSSLYFIRLDNEGNMAKAGKPYCTICSKSALDVGIANFVLWHEGGITVYDTIEYNELSFKYDG